MGKNTLSELIQSITGLAIVAGLALVVWELQQNREATMSQLTSEGYQFSTQVELPVLGEEPAEVLAKACFAPNRLTEADLFRLNGIYSQRIVNLQRLLVLESRGSFYEEGYWRTYGEFQFGIIFRTEVGRNYWQQFRKTWRPDIRAYGDEFLSHLGEPDCADLYGGWRDLNRTIESK